MEPARVGPAAIGERSQGEGRQKEAHEGRIEEERAGHALPKPGVRRDERQQQQEEDPDAVGREDRRTQPCGRNGKAIAQEIEPQRRAERQERVKARFAEAEAPVVAQIRAVEGVADLLEQKDDAR